MAGLFSARFLVAVTQHAGSSHVIIEGEKNGNPWQLMQGLKHVRSAKAEDSAGGGSSCQICSTLQRFLLIVVQVHVSARLHVLFFFFVSLQGAVAVDCNDPSLIRCNQGSAFARCISFISASFSFAVLTFLQG